MRFDDEIVRAIKRQATTDTLNSKTDDELKVIEEAVRAAVSSANYDFSKSESKSEENNSIMWANILSYSRYYSSFFDEVKDKLEKIIDAQISRMSIKEPMMQAEFWYILIFHNCPCLSSVLRDKIDFKIDDIQNTEPLPGRVSITFDLGNLDACTNYCFIMKLFSDDNTLYPIPYRFAVKLGLCQRFNCYALRGEISSTARQ
jgi:hypothetical protein